MTDRFASRQPITSADLEHTQTAEEVRQLIDAVRNDPNHPFNRPDLPGHDLAHADLLKFYEKELELKHKAKDWDTFTLLENAKRAGFEARERSRYRREPSRESYELMEAAKAAGLPVPDSPEQWPQPLSWRPWQNAFKLGVDGRLQIDRRPPVKSLGGSVSQAIGALGSDELPLAEAPAGDIDADSKEIIDTIDSLSQIQYPGDPTPRPPSARPRRSRRPLSSLDLGKAQTSGEVRQMINAVRADPDHPFNRPDLPGHGFAHEDLLKFYEKERKLKEKEEAGGPFAWVQEAASSLGKEIRDGLDRLERASEERQRHEAAEQWALNEQARFEGAPPIGDVPRPMRLPGYTVPGYVLSPWLSDPSSTGYAGQEFSGLERVGGQTVTRGLGRLFQGISGRIAAQGEAPEGGRNRWAGGGVRG